MKSLLKECCSINTLTTNVGGDSRQAHLPQPYEGGSMELLPGLHWGQTALVS